MKNFKKLITILLCLAVLVSSFIISGSAVDTTKATDTDFTDIESGYLSDTFVFDFDNIYTYEVNKDYGVDEEGNLFYPLHSSNSNATVKQKNFVVDGETVTTAEVSMNTHTVYIPTDENGQPYIIDPNTTYSVKITYYNMAAHSHGQFFMGGGTLASNEQACNTSAMGKTFHLWEYGKNKFTDTTGWNPFYRCTGMNWKDAHRYNPTASFKTESNSFQTLDFTTENGMFYNSTYNTTNAAFNDDSYAFGKYFGIYFSANNVSYDDGNGTAYSGNTVYYIDKIEITANRSRTLKVGESYTFNFSEGEVKDATANNTAFKDGDGNTFYPFHAELTGSSATQENINVKVDAAGNTETIGALKFVNNGHTQYIPTDKNGTPFVVEPNTKYKVEYSVYVQYNGGEGQFFPGGGIYNANNKKYSMLTSSYNGQDTWYYIGGSTGKSNSTTVFTPDMYCAYPMFRTASLGYVGSKNGNMYSSNALDPAKRVSYYTDFDKTRSNQYKPGTTYFETGDFESTGNTFTADLWNWYYYAHANGKGYALGITDPYSDLAKENNVEVKTGTLGAYFGIYGGGGSITAYDAEGNKLDSQLSTFYIDSITITKVSTTNTASVTFDANGGTFSDGSSSKPAVQTVETAPTVEAPTAADSALAFAGWSTSEKGDVITEITSDMDGKTLYAIYKTPVAKVTFDANGGSLANGSATKATTQYLGMKFTEPNPVKTGYIFKGWGTSASATTPVTLAAADMADKTLYAIWKSNPVNITFNANGGAFSDETTQKIASQVVGIAPIVEEPLRGIDKFIGWGTSADSTTAIDKITLDMAGTTLYAIWDSCHPENGVYDSWGRTVEFDQYVVSADANTFKPTGDAYGENSGVLYFKTIDDPDEEGDKLLHFYNHSGASGWNANWCITPTPNGVSNTTSDAASGQVLPTGSTFRMTLRVRINSTGGGSPSVAMYYGTSNGRNSITADTSCTATTSLVTGLQASSEWQIIETYFTTPEEYPVMSAGGNVANRLFVGLLCAGYNMDYDLDYIKLEKVTNINLFVKENDKYVLRETITGNPGDVATLPEFYSEENYSLYDPTGTSSKMLYGNWFADEACTSDAIHRFGNYDANLYCDGVTAVPSISTENQEMFVGFDTYTQRTEGLKNAALTKEAYNSGTVSLKAEVTSSVPALFELKNDHTLDVLNGKTYRVDFAYKTDAEATLDIGLAEGVVADGVESKNSVVLKATDEWTTASVIFTADGAKENSVLAAKISSVTGATVYIDTMIVSSATESVGVEAETTDDGEALRFMLSYNGSDTITMAGNDFTVAEHGVIVKGQEVGTALTLDNADKAEIFHFAQTDMSKNWSVNPITGTTVYSAYLSGFDKNDDYKVSVRGYIKLSDSTVYYTDILTASVTDIPAAGDIIPENADLSDYYVYLPEGTTLPADADYTVTTYDDTFKANSAVKNNVVTVGSYVLFSSGPDFEKITVPSELKYMVHAGTKDELYYGLNAQVVSEKISAVGKDTVNYLFITDIHFGSSLTTAQEVVLNKEAALMTKMANENDDIDFVVIGGDTTTGMYGSKEQAIKWTHAALDPFLECTKPVFALMGNHDDNSYHIAAGDKQLKPERVITDLDWQNYIIDRYTNKGNIQVVQDDPAKRANSKYFYYDLEDKNTRVIALDAIDYEARYDENGFVIDEDLNGDGFFDGMPIKDAAGTTGSKYHNGYTYWGYSADQVRWLAEDALGQLPADYDVIFVSHMGIDKITNSYGTTIWFSENIREIIKSFNAGGSYTANLTDIWGDAVSVNADFAGKNGDIIAWQFGHQHIELSLYESDVDLWQICTPSASVAQTGTQTNEAVASGVANRKDLPWRVYTRKLGNSTEANFNVMSVSSERVYRFTVGQGNNEKLVYPE